MYKFFFHKNTQDDEEVFMRDLWLQRTIFLCKPNEGCKIIVTGSLKLNESESGSSTKLSSGSPVRFSQ